MLLADGMCQNTVTAWRLVGFLVMVLKVLVPVIIIATSVVPLFNALIKGTADETIKSWKQIARKIAAGLIIFLIPSLITAAVNSFAKPAKGDDILICMDCFDKPGSDECSKHIQDYKDLEKEDIQDFKEEEPGGSVNSSDMQDVEKQQDKNNNDSNNNNDNNNSSNNSSNQYNYATGDNTNAPQTSAGANSSNLKQFSASNGINMSYYEILPSNVTDNLPLIIFLHGSGETNNPSGVGSLPIVSYVSNEYSGQSFIFLAPVAPSYGWNGGNLVAAKEIIDSTVQKYNVDRNHIIITGMSMGGHGVYYMLGAYGNFFSAAVPMSGCNRGNNVANFASVPLLGIVGSNDSDFTSCMAADINSINANGGHANLVTKPGATHSTIQGYYRDKELFNWMLSQ